MSRQLFRSMTLLILGGALLAACAVPVSLSPLPIGTVPPHPTSPPTPTAPCPSAGEVTTARTMLRPADVLLQLAWEGGLTRPELASAFGRIPEFTLLPDGNAYYLDPSESDMAEVMTARLTPAEMEELIQRVLDLGFERLESFTDSCQPQEDGTCMCVADAGESVLRARLPNGDVREIRNYGDFANDREVLAAIRTLLQDYQHPAAETYKPDKAALFIRSISPLPEHPIRDWPLSPAWLTGATPDATCARALSGTDLQTLLAATVRNAGDFYFGADGQVYNVYLVPWLPGVDYTDFIASSGQTCPLAETPTSVPSAAATTVALTKLTVSANVDGRSQLVVQGNTIHWHHLDWAAPGRHLDLGSNEPTYLNGEAWYPTWPDRPDTENRDCDCNSSTHVGIPLLAAREQTVSLEILQARDKVTIIQQPEAENDYTLIVEFDDDASLGPDWYDVAISYITGEQPLGPPATPGQLDTATPVATPTPLPTVVESGLSNGWSRYTNLEYGFSFRFPPGWALEQGDHFLILRHPLTDTLQFRIAYRRAGEDVESGRTGMPAGDFFARGSVPWLGREISRDILVYKGKDKLVLYNYSSAIPWGNLIFALILENTRSDYVAAELPADVQGQIDQVVMSFELAK